MRAVLDPNVIISAMLSRQGTPARLMRGWILGEFELVTSARLLAELERALGYPKIARRVAPADARQLLDELRAHAQQVDDPREMPAVRSPDPGDDYLIALAATAGAALVSGDADLTGLADRIPVYSPAAFADLLTLMG